MVTTSSMTVTRALAELKLLEKRIQKKTSDLKAVSTRVAGKTWEDHAKKSQSDFDSITDLINRRNAIKLAVIESNARTHVTVGGTDYTVAGAIAYKDLVGVQAELADTLSHQYSVAEQQVALHETQVQVNLERLLNTSFQSSGDGSNATDIQAVKSAYLESNKIEIIDPLNARDRSTTLREKVENFLSEVDFVLSESNATTTIEITV